MVMIIRLFWGSFFFGLLVFSVLLYDCYYSPSNCVYHKFQRGCRGSDHMVVGFTTTCVISTYHD
jgi:hypothetical protein